MRIEVCFSSDDQYAQHLAVALASLLHHRALSDQVSVSVLDGGITEENRRRLEDVAEQGGARICFLPVKKDEFRNAPLQTSADGPTHISLAAYYRLLLEELLPDVDKVIYLDCDLVCRASLAELYGQDMGNDWIRGVADIDEERHTRRLGLRRYVCSGVLLLNLRAWRENNVQQKCMDFIRNHANIIVLHDQDVLNVVCQEHLSCLDKTWDAQACETRQGRISGFNDIARTANIIHFIGGRKPWQPGCRHPYRREYFRYLKLTPFCGRVWRHRLDCILYFLAHTKFSHGRKRWYVCGIRLFQKRMPGGDRSVRQDEPRGTEDRKASETR